MAIAPVLTTDRNAMVSENPQQTQSHREAAQHVPSRSRDATRLLRKTFTYSVDLPTGKVVIDAPFRAPVLKEFNDLHLNAPKGVWTYVADVYAVSLILLAVTGLFVLKGKNGITRRGAWLTAIGVVIPRAFWIYHLSLVLARERAPYLQRLRRAGLRGPACRNAARDQCDRENGDDGGCPRQRVRRLATRTTLP